MARPMRRVVTGHNAQGKSVFLMDGPSSHVLELEAVPRLALIDLWVTDRAPGGGNAGTADPPARPGVPEPPSRGTIFRGGDFPPERPGGTPPDRPKLFRAMG